MRKFFGALAGLLLALAVPSIAAAQTACPAFTRGKVLTAGEWQACFDAKQNALGYVPLNKAGDTMLGRLVISAPSGNVGFFNLTPGSVPGSPNNGDMWVTSSGLFVRINGLTVGPLAGGGSGSFAATAPISVTFPAGITTYALDFNSSLVNTAGSLGINLAHSNTFSAAQTINLNAASLPSAISGAGLNIGAVDGGVARMQLSAFGAIASVSGAIYAGTAASPTQVLSGTQLTGINAYAYTGSALVGPIASFRTYAAENITASAWGTKGCIATTPSTTAVLTDGLCQQNSGGITIGSPTGGDKGVGTLNAAGTIYINGTAVTAAAITALTGDVTATGPGSAAATLATVNSNVGSFGSTSAVPSFTVNGKGLITAASSAAYRDATSAVKGIVQGDGSTLTITAGVIACTTSTTSQFGCVKPDGATITISGGVITAVGGSATTITVGTTTVVSGTSGRVLFNNGTLGEYVITGTGNVVMSASPTLTGTIAAASATFSGTVNKLTLTQPATGSTLTIVDGKTLTANNSITLAGTDGTTWTGPSTNATLASLNIADQVVTGGFLITSQQQSSGSITPDFGSRTLQWIINTGAFTITAPTPSTNVGYANIRVINGSGAGAITFPTGSAQATSWSVGSNTGDTFATAVKSTASCTATNASPAVYTYTAHGLPNGWPVYLSGTTAPTGFTLGTVYYTASVATNTFQLAATPGGASINSSSTGTSVVCNAASQYELAMLQNIGGATYAWKALQ